MDHFYVHGLSQNVSRGIQRHAEPTARAAVAILAASITTS